ncbi:MAG: hypothetical protein FD180_47 [Planctomycetota bacterium]|nr:MAG: hypothetical protein FD180_47 [Planctomycetota bacterium]
MKTLIPFLLIALALPAVADDPDDLDPGAKAVFESVQSAWSSGGHEKIGVHFEKDSKVSLSLDDSGSYSRDQAIARLKKYFDTNKTKSLKLEKDGYEGGNNPRASYEYEYTDAEGNKQKATLVVTLRKKGDRWVVSTISRL